MMTTDPPDSQAAENQRKHALEHAYNQGPACSHPQDPSTGCCLVCHQSVCNSCAFPLADCQYICLKCIDVLKDEQETRVVDPEDSGSIFTQLPKTPVSLWFTVFLVVLYVISAFPGIQSANDSFLGKVSLGLLPILKHHQYWRLLTANLFHANLAHLLTNCFAILVFGHLTEFRAGPKALVLWMLASLLGCDLFTLALMPGAESIGASGIAIGLEAGIVILMGRVVIARQLQDRRETLRSLVGFVVLIVLINMFSEHYINIYGHLGGAFAGIICALLYPVNRPYGRQDTLRLCIWLGLLSLAVVGIISFYGALLHHHLV